ncbi:hypothetical protein D9M68_878510 [compost metagenome]
MAAECIGIDLQAQQAKGFLGRVTDEQGRFEVAAFAEEEVAEQPVTACTGWTGDAGQGHVAVVDDLCADHRWRAQQAQHQFLSQFGVDVVGDAGCRIVADLHQRANLAVDGGVFTGIIDAHLNQAEHRAEDKRHQYGQAGLFERQALG